MTDESSAIHDISAVQAVSSDQTMSSTSQRPRTKRLRKLVEAGAAGRPLSPVVVKEICEALRQQADKVPTRFHSGAGA